MSQELSFWIDKGILRYFDGGCGPATTNEKEMWALLLKHGLVGGPKEEPSNEAASKPSGTD